MAKPSQNPGASSQAAGAKHGRALQHFEHEGTKYAPNDLFEGEESAVAALHDAGHIDAHPDAAEHALKHGRRVAKSDDAEQ